MHQNQNSPKQIEISFKRFSVPRTIASIFQTQDHISRDERIQRISEHFKDAVDAAANGDVEGVTENIRRARWIAWLEGAKITIVSSSASKMQRIISLAGARKELLALAHGVCFQNEVAEIHGWHSGSLIDWSIGQLGRKKARLHLEAAETYAERAGLKVDWDRVLGPECIEALGIKPKGYVPQKVEKTDFGQDGWTKRTYIVDAD